MQNTRLPSTASRIDPPATTAPLAPPLTAPGPVGFLRARRATRIEFMALGMLAGTWGAHVPSVKSHYALGEGMLALVLFAAAAGAVLSLLVAGRVVGRLGARKATALASLAMALALASVLEHRGMATLLPAMVMFGAAMSIFDVAINTEGSTLESLAERAVMSNLHGMFSVGAMAGAALVAYLLASGVAPRVQLFALCAGTAVVAVAAAAGMLPTHAEPASRGATAHFAWPRGLLLVIGLLVFAGMIAEGVMYDWSVLYLQQSVGMSQASAAAGYAVFTAAMALARFGGDALRARHPERRLLRVGATLAAAAMTLVLLTATPWIALAGFALVGAGLAPVAPILINAATRVPGVSRAAAIASVTSIGYAGFMVGPPLIGSIATVASLPLALAVVVLAAALLAYGARFVPERPTEARLQRIT